MEGLEALCSYSLVNFTLSQSLGVPVWLPRACSSRCDFYLRACGAQTTCQMGCMLPSSRLSASMFFQE